MKAHQFGAVTGCIAHCTVCGKEWQGQQTARDQARRHNRTTGHRVIVEETRVIEYVLRKDTPHA